RRVAAGLVEEATDIGGRCRRGSRGSRRSRATARLAGGGLLGGRRRGVAQLLLDALQRVQNPFQNSIHLTSPLLLTSELLTTSGQPGLACGPRGSGCTLLSPGSPAQCAACATRSSQAPGETGSPSQPPRRSDAEDACPSHPCGRPP